MQANENLNKPGLTRLFISYLLVFSIFVAVQAALLLLNNDEVTLRFGSVGLLLAVGAANWTLVKLFKPSALEWQALIGTASAVSLRLLVAASAIGLAVFWPVQAHGFGQLWQLIQATGWLFLLMAVVAWLVSLWLGVKLYQLIMYKVGEFALTGKLRQV